MNAAFYTQYGKPEYLSLKKMDVPSPGDNDVLVEVHAATVNRSDYAILKGAIIMRLLTGLSKPKRSVPGSDFAGIVIHTGKSVTKYKKGDRIFGFEDMGLSSHAQFLVINENKAISKIPDTLDYDKAVALLEGVHYAINFINKVKLVPGQKVLVNGATGAIGSALVQLCKYYGLNVTATCRGEHTALVKSIGADIVIDYTKENFLNTSDRYDYVFDSVGKSTFGKCKTILKEKGIYISSELGPRAENPFLAILTKFIGDKKVIFPIPFNVNTSIELILKIYNEGKFIPVIDRKYKLKDIQEAFRYVSTGQKTGNVVLDMQH